MHQGPTGSGPAPAKSPGSVSTIYRLFEGPCAGYPFGPTGGDVEPGVPGLASTGVPFGRTGGGTDPGAPGGARIGVPFGPMITEICFQRTRSNEEDVP